MKNDIHPAYVVTQVTCSCGNSFTTRSTVKSGQLHAEVCSACHPFYTGKQKIMDVGGRVDKFETPLRQARPQLLTAATALRAAGSCNFLRRTTAGSCTIACEER